MTLKSRTSPSPLSAAFKRGRSKVFYASEDPSLPKLSSEIPSHEPAAQTTTMFGNHKEKSLTVEAPPWGPALGTCKEANEASSSGDEASSPTSCAIRSPVGSLRSSVGGSLRGSQDSGYSDSGESNCGGSPEIDAEEFAPRVKHISRVFFGGSSGSGRARLYSDTIVASGPMSLPITPRISSNGAKSLQSRTQLLRNGPTDTPDAESSLRSSPTSICDSDEPQYEMECKSLLEISSNSYDEQASRKTGAIRKASYVSCHRKGPRRSTSADKLLLDDPKPRRPCILKARRRWSTVDVKHSHSQGSGPLSLSFMSDCRDSEHQQHDHPNQDLPLKPILTEPCALGGVITKKTNVKRLRIHPTALAAEMKNGSLSQWLQEVRGRAETECMNTLQSKSLATEPHADPLSAVDAVRSVQRRAHAVSTEFARLCQRLELRQHERLPALSRSLVAHVNAFLREPSGPSAGAAGPKSTLCRQIEVIRQICHRLMEITTTKSNDFVTPDLSEYHSCTNDDDRIHATNTQKMFESSTDSRKESEYYEENKKFSSISNENFEQKCITCGNENRPGVKITLCNSEDARVSLGKQEQSPQGVTQTQCNTEATPEQSPQGGTLTQCNTEANSELPPQDTTLTHSNAKANSELPSQGTTLTQRSAEDAPQDAKSAPRAAVEAPDGGSSAGRGRAASCVKEAAQVVTALGHAFTKLVDILLSLEIKEVIACLERDCSSEESVRSALRQVTSLGVDGGHICRLIAKLGGVRALLALCVEPGARALRVAALRALATVCCVADGIAHLEKAGGMEVIVEILCDESSPEEEKSEAAAVLAQITSPWVEENHGIVSLARHVAPVVTALTGLVQTTESAEIFLLGSAALANLTFLSTEGLVAAMLAAGTPSVLLRAAHSPNGLSVFTKDQIATVVCSLCSSKEGAAAVAAEGGLETLVGLLHTNPPPHPARMPEITAAERVQQKSAIAISRLCSAPSCGSAVLQLGGGDRLVRLCKDEAERNHSDAVLVACLAALRKIASSCEKEKLRDIGAADLVEPRLLDSFLNFSSRQESYV